MSSPIDALRRGIAAGDWPLVCDGFRLLTGEAVDPPAAGGPGPEWRGALLDSLRAAQALVSALAAFSTVEACGAGPEPPAAPEPPPAAKSKGAKPKGAKGAKKPPKKITPPGPAGEDGDEDGEGAEEAEEEAEGAGGGAGGRAARAPSMEERFRVQHGRAAGDGDGDGEGSACRLVPHEPPRGPNKFRPDRREAAEDLADSISLSKKKAPEPRRPKSSPVKVACFKCGRREEVPRALAPRAPADKGDKSAGRAQHVCVKCLRREMV